MNKEALLRIADMLNRNAVDWGLGGSSMLWFHGLVDRPNDIDLLVAEHDALRAHELLSRLGTHEAVKPKEPFCTKHFTQYTILGTEVDVIGLFGIRHAEGVYRLDWRRDESTRVELLEGVSIPLTPLEDWFVLYLLMSGRGGKADLIEACLKRQGVRRDRLEAALRQPLPAEVRARACRYGSNGRLRQALRRAFVRASGISLVIPGDARTIELRQSARMPRRQAKRHHPIIDGDHRVMVHSLRDVRDPVYKRDAAREGGEAVFFYQPLPLFHRPALKAGQPRLHFFRRQPAPHALPPPYTKCMTLVSASP